MFAIDMLLVFISESVDAVYSLTKTDRRPMFAAFVNILNACCAWYSVFFLSAAAWLVSRESRTTVQWNSM